MITEISSPLIEIAWLPWAVTYFFFIGISYGAVCLTLPSVLFGKEQHDKLTRLAMLVMIVSVLAAMAGLLGDLHQPGRFWRFYTNITPNSWMSIGALLLPVYLFFIFTYAWFYLRSIASEKAEASWITRLIMFGNWDSRKLLKPVALLTTLMAALIVLYTGSEVIIVKARPLWNSYYLMFFYFASGLSGAISASLLIGLLVNVDAKVKQSLSRWLRWSLLLFISITLLWIYSAYTGNGAPADALARLQGAVDFKRSVVILLAIAVSGIIISYTGRALIWLVPITGLAVTWFSRWIIFIDGQRIPKFGAGTYPYQLPSGDEGLLGILGVFGLALFLAIVFYQFLPWHFSFASNATTSPRSEPTQ